MTSTSPAPGSTTTHAVVHAGHRATPYARAGSGAPVVLLLQSDETTALGASLFEALADTHRVFAPECEGAGSDDAASFSGWLRAFLDGLGLSDVRLVAGDRLGVAALGFALLEPERIERLALIHADAPDPAGSDDVLHERLAETGLPLMLVRLGARAVEGPDAIARLTAFLDGDRAPVSTAVIPPMCDADRA